MDILRIKVGYKAFVMKRILIFSILLVMGLPQALSADAPLKEHDYSWMADIREDHPRMFLTREDIPIIRIVAQSYENETFLAMKKRADKLLGQTIVWEDPLAKTGESTSNKTYGYYAADAAMMWLITQDRQYLDLAKYILKELTDYYDLRVSHNLNIEWYALTQICAMCTYDWIYNDLAPEERKELGNNLFNVMCDIAWHGPRVREHRFRENVGNYQSGCYGPPVLPWYIGLTFWKEGFDDEYCKDMVRHGYDLHQKMTAFRSSLLGENGGGPSSVPGYAFAYYPYAEYDFFYTFRSATGIDLSKEMSYMIGYLNYMDWIRLPGNKEYGFGDCNHYQYTLPHQHMNGHVAEIANLFGKEYPEILPVASRLLKNFNKRRAFDVIPFIRLLHKIDPSALEAEEAEVKDSPKAMYFESMGQLYMRSGTGDDDTYVLFVTGGEAEKHRHYDNNNFIIYKHGYRALDSGTRPEPGLHLPYYYCRTVAHNCITIYMPGERLPKYWGGAASTEDKTLPLPNDGGQNKIIGSRLLEMRETEQYVYVASDATASYHEDKAEKVIREFVWCAPDVFVIFDRVVSDEPDYKKTWLYHTADEPIFDGNLEFSEKSQGGKSICRTLFPKDAVVTKIGGPGRQFWSDGRNWPIPELTPEDYGYNKRHLFPPNDHPLVGQWRVEVTPAKAAASDVFMHMIQVGNNSLKSLPKTKTFEDAQAMGVEFKYNGKTFRMSFDKTKDYGCQITVK